MTGSSKESAQTLFMEFLESEWRAIGTRFEIPLRRTASRFCLLTSFDPQKFDAGYALTQDDTQWEMRRIAVGSFSFPLLH